MKLSRHICSIFFSSLFHFIYALYFFSLSLVTNSLHTIPPDARISISSSSSLFFSLHKLSGIVSFISFILSSEILLSTFSLTDILNPGITNLYFSLSLSFSSLYFLKNVLSTEKILQYNFLLSFGMVFSLINNK